MDIKRNLCKFITKKAWLRPWVYIGILFTI